MHGCPDVMKLMYAFLDNELDAERTVRVRTHLRECAACCYAFLSEREFLEMFKSQILATSPRTKVCN